MAKKTAKLQFPPPLPKDDKSLAAAAARRKKFGIVEQVQNLRRDQIDAVTKKLNCEVVDDVVLAQPVPAKLRSNSGGCRAMTDAELGAVLEFIRDPLKPVPLNVRLMIEFLVSIGGRVGDGRHLTWGLVRDEEHGWLEDLILPEGYGKASRGRGSKERNCKLTWWCTQAAKKVRRERSTGNLFHGRDQQEGMKPYDLVFAHPAHPDQAVPYEYFRRWMKWVFWQALGSNYRLSTHAPRKTMAVMAINQENLEGDRKEFVKTMLGHRSSRSTESYISAPPQTHRKNVAKLHANIPGGTRSAKPADAEDDDDLVQLQFHSLTALAIATSATKKQLAMANALRYDNLARDRQAAKNKVNAEKRRRRGIRLQRAA